MCWLTALTCLIRDVVQRRMSVLFAIFGTDLAVHVHPVRCENHLINVFLALPAMDVWLQVDVCDIMDEVVGFAPVEAEDCLKGPGGSRFSE